MSTLEYCGITETASVFRPEVCVFTPSLNLYVEKKNNKNMDKTYQGVFFPTSKLSAELLAMIRS